MSMSRVEHSETPSTPPTLRGSPSERGLFFIRPDRRYYIRASDRKILP